MYKIEVCHRAEITMWIHDNRVHFTWTPRHFKENQVSTAVYTKDKTAEQIDHDHRYACPDVSILEEHDNYFDLDYSDIFDNQGCWNVQHVRRLVHVLDSFRISHEAYHELRMVSKGHLPPIWRIAVQKKIMSDQIPYIKHLSVRYILFVISTNVVKLTFAMFAQSFN